ncbi:hypothetical protein KC19_3G058200 [Ceratodon purpureus]|uniref:Uncharacterized protein n=1 Tax=Ceratodon purpureus TaxID=3225 RepID=A0A8T0IHM4_CERPU|nr:hypothetical protein KC19_3G058200 [Ceratodon purpureus]
MKAHSTIFHPEIHNIKTILDVAPSFNKEKDRMICYVCNASHRAQHKAQETGNFTRAFNSATHQASRQKPSRHTKNCFLISDDLRIICTPYQAHIPQKTDSM